MKKVSPPHSRKRALSEEEKALWRAVAKSTTPLRRRKPVIDVDDDEEVHTPQPGVRQSRPSSALQPRPTTARPSPPPLAPLGRREKSRLAKGRNAIDARIDLHGMTQARAHRALIAFLHRAHSDGATFVLVITGKGKASVLDRERGVLRRQVPLWLALPDLRSLVVGYEEAHIGHGGEGALYVRLRRAR
jgi:DNA-nicking Smr family endonuclease